MQLSEQQVVRPRLNPRLAAGIRAFAKKRGLKDNEAASFLLADALEREGLWPPPEPPREAAPEPR